MNKFTLPAASIVSVALLALVQPAAAHMVSGPSAASLRVSVTGKPAAAVSEELTHAARQVCGKSLKGGARHPNYASCVTETLGQARADYAALRTAAKATGE
ncbi:hypothetical protein [Caulobacter hibisci]|uniref:UrcA family protein n=1 Tax=Caulobacter hibisci TaxID=2035993 RepID=A0ABS0SSM8_9CAUL|nr:hypothetical protein [Caulobacter hibisci]MBI1682186.1 hypothetical protein [Caulobacter hibisci]